MHEKKENTYYMLLLFSCQVVSNSLQPHRLQHHFLEPAPIHVPQVGDAI